jgi:hypothetical protein
VRYCENDKISRRLRDLADGFRTARRSIVLMAATIELPKELVADAAEFQLELPSNKKQQLSTEVLLGARRDSVDATIEHDRRGRDSADSGMGEKQGGSGGLRGEPLSNKGKGW